MKHELRLLLVALQFLTRVPVPSRVGFDAAWLNASARHFPGVGVLVGAFGAVVLWAATVLWPLPVAVGLSIAATVWLTGGFHEDGLADTCDALGGAVERARALEIMKDSRIGSYGALGLVLVLGIKAACLVALGPWQGSLALLLGHAASRTAAVGVMRFLPYAGDVGTAKAKPLAQQVSSGGFTVAMLWVALTALALVPWWTSQAIAAALGAGALATWCCARWFRRRLGGFTGDTLGATQQFAELACYLGALALR